MSFNFTAIKAALKEAGHVVSEGEQVLAADLKELYTFAHFHFGLNAQQVSYGLAYPQTITTAFPGHPDAASAPVETPAPVAAPVAETPAPEPEPVAEIPAPAPTPEPAPTPPVPPVQTPVPPVETPAPTPAKPAADAAANAEQEKAPT